MTKKNSFKYEELIECAEGKLFGPGNAKLPSPPMLMFDRITNIQEGKGRALGVNAVKFTGEVLKKAKLATYEINMKRILVKKGTTVGLANGILVADDKKIYLAENLKVGLFK